MDICVISTFGLINNTAMNIHVQDFLWILQEFSFLLGLYLGVEFLGLYVTLYVICWGTDRLISKATAPFYFPTNSVMRVPVQRLVFSHFLIWAILVGMK